MNSRSVILVLAGASLVLLLPACRQGRETSSTPNASPSPQHAECERSLPFRPTFLPPDFDPNPHPGAGGGAELPESYIAFHYRGPYNAELNAYPVHINAFRGPGMYDVYDPEATPITVLGSAGRLGGIHEGFGVEFVLTSEPKGCQRFTLEAFGVSLQELRSFAEGLERK